MRGKAVDTRSWKSQVGITPAYAGKSSERWWCPRPPRDHPRVCGEKGASARSWQAVQGSPPRMRGKGEGLLHPRLPDGITPAYAGKSFQIFDFVLWCWDHPRVCGEKVYRDDPYNAGQGSPPRMRGKVDRCSSSSPLFGITPAYAGKSCCVSALFRCSWDHPRVCGEKERENLADSLCPGSPPRMRGKGESRKHTKFCCGITPAYAGKSWLHPLSGS